MTFRPSCTRWTRHYSDVFDKTPEAVELSDDLLGDQVGQAEERLSAAGFLDSPSALELVRGWIAPAHRAANDRRGPGLVRRLVPALLENIAKGPAPDDALRRFNRFLSAVDDPIKLLSLLTARPALVELAADLAGSAPALIDELATMPELLESALEAGFMTDVPEPRLLRADCAVTLGEAFDLDGIAGNLGRWIKENRFPIVTGLSRQEMNAREAGQSLSEIYEAAIWGLVARVMEICRADDTAVPDVTLAVVALGRLADRNLTARSALDLAFVLDDSPDPEQADDRQRSAQAERANVVARQIIGCLGHESGAGGVSVGSTSGIGSIADGNLVLPLSALKRRVSELDREPLIEFAGARVVAGEAGLAERIESLLPSLAGVGLERSEINRRFGIARNRLLDGVTDADAWDLEGRQGGLSEFHLVIDYFRITEEIARARTCGQPGVQAVESLSDAGLLDSSLARDLVHAGRLINGLQHFLHAALGPVEARIDLGDAQHDAIARVAGQTNFEDVERTLAAVLRYHRQGRNRRDRSAGITVIRAGGVRRPVIHC